MNINIKISRDLLLIFGLALALALPLKMARADLDKNFRENFREFTQEKCHNSIEYSVDDLDGFELVETDGVEKWECQKYKCQDYHQTVNCLFDDAFEQGVNKINSEVKKYANQHFTGLRHVYPNTNFECSLISLESIQEEQESLGFRSSCSRKGLSGDFHSPCRVTETVLNELCGYQNFLTAKINDRQSFYKEKLGYDGARVAHEELFKLKSIQHQAEINKSRKAFLDSVILYKNFIHSYRIHAWLVGIKEKINTVMKDWQKIHQALETFPDKFINASSRK